MGWRLWEMAQTTQLHHLGLLVSFFFLYSFFFSNLTSTYRLYQYIKGWRGSDGMAITGNGPNDAIASFGPFSYFFFLSFLFSYY